MSDKPLPKSLHTVKVLNLVTKHFMSLYDLTPEVGMNMTLHLLQLIDKPDTYGLAATALKQLEASK
jgi:hypothetical protein